MFRFIQKIDEFLLGLLPRRLRSRFVSQTESVFGHQLVVFGLVGVGRLIALWSMTAGLLFGGLAFAFYMFREVQQAKTDPFNTPIRFTVEDQLGAFAGAVFGYCLFF